MNENTRKYLLVVNQISNFPPHGAVAVRKVVELPAGADALAEAEKLIPSMMNAAHSLSNWHAYEVKDEAPYYEVRNIFVGENGEIYGELWKDGRIEISATLDYIHARLPELLKGGAQ